MSVQSAAKQACCFQHENVQVPETPCAFWQIAVDSRQCADAVLPEALCRHKALSGGAHIIHNGKLWLVSRHAAVGTGVLCHDWLDCVPGMLVTSHDS